MRGARLKLAEVIENAHDYGGLGDEGNQLHAATVRRQARPACRPSTRLLTPQQRGACKSANLNGFHGNLTAAVDKSMAWRLAHSSFDWVAMWLARMQSAEYRAF